MPFSIKILFTLLALALATIAVWVLRPSQQRSVASSWFRLGARDPLFRALFDETGRPRKFSWLWAVGWTALWLALVWVV